MPRVKRFPNCAIYVYHGDHSPPHFHIVGRDASAMVEIGTLRVLGGDAWQFREALEWAGENGDVLAAAWNRMNERG